MDHENDAALPAVGRRGFLGLAALALTGLVAAGAAAVALVFAAGPALRRGEEAEGAWSPVEGAVKGAGGGPTRHAVTVVSDEGWAQTAATHAVFLDAGASGAVRAFSARCPHEGCLVEWSADRSSYVCPCHASSWTREGERIGGPTKRGLDPLEVRVEGETVEVRYRTFALDTPDRVPVA